MGIKEGNVNLDATGRQILQRCGGVPLAITAIGSILCSKSLESEWLRVKDSEIWALEDEGKRILAVLMLSYEHLPPYMKQCFSFCSLFPKDSVMVKDELIGLWMANGFIPSRRLLDLHDTGCEIFSELTRRSFLQEIKEDVDGTVTCKMLDLIHDIATTIMGHGCCVIEPNERLKIPKTARHLFVHNSSSSTNIMDLSKLQPLHSLILGNEISFCGIYNLSNPAHNTAFKSLKQLRYLCLHDGNMKTLPESTIFLYNLQTLNLQYCHSLEMLPKDTRHLKNLKYLDLRSCSLLTSMPVGLGQLSCLRKLSMFVVGKDIGCGGIDELKELALVGELSITGLHNIKSLTEAKNANLKKKQNLSSLSLSWQVESLETSHHQHRNDEEILNVLQPHSSLKKLCIFGYQGDRFPYWMMDLLLPNLVEISLEDCEICDQLPPLGKLRFLKVLTIKVMGALKYIDSNFYGDMESSFPSLKVLEIGMAPCLEEWTTVNGREQFPLLRSLTIKCCPKLVKMPMLQSLKKLEIGGINVTLLKSLMMNATILTSLWINEVDELTDLPDGLLQNQKHLDSLTIVSSTLKSLSDMLDNLSTLEHLELESCLQLESLPAGLQNISSLKTLDLSQCDSLVSLPANGLQGLLSLSSLRI
ncbi:putative disease resistance protein RGA1 [Gossypium hirsutum]|uniref:Disease resistance protein RGA1 n=1 Tax=Gossypium hirsutum TaxID=3635 RepID=A0ABM2Z5J6_GOSHI|nr:putative disease resistance protein RGA1 [Gossypium hirsutum]